MQKVYYVLEIAWLLVAIATFTTGVVIYFNQTPQASYLFFILAAISGVIYIYRRRQRLRWLTKQQQ